MSPEQLADPQADPIGVVEFVEMMNRAEHRRETVSIDEFLDNVDEYEA